MELYLVSHYSCKDVPWKLNSVQSMAFGMKFVALLIAGKKSVFIQLLEKVRKRNFYFEINPLPKSHAFNDSIISGICVVKITSGQQCDREVVWVVFLSFTCYLITIFQSYRHHMLRNANLNISRWSFKRKSAL